MSESIIVQYSLRYARSGDGTITDVAIYDADTHKRLISLTQDAGIDDHAVLLRLHHKYLLLKVPESAVSEYGLVDVFNEAIEPDSTDLMCGYGRLYARTRRSATGVPCRHVFLDTKAIARREGSLRFYPVGIRGLGNVDMEATGSIDQLYVQFNNLL